MLKFAFKDASTKNSEPTYWTILFVMLKIYFIRYVCTGNKNSKSIWNKFIIRKDIIETSQVVLNFCRTVYIR
jgi:hypothetical protein